MEWHAVVGCARTGEYVMAPHYRQKQPMRQRTNFFGQLLLAGVFFIAGYLSASLYDLTHLSGWIGSHLLAKNTSQVIIRNHPKPAPLPKPKFEFYTLLANERIADSEPAAPKGGNVTVSANMTRSMTPAASSNALLPTKPESLQPVENHPASAHDNHDAYLVQVGSFRNMREAERMKAMLVMKGFDVHIASAIQQHVNWYRVIIGPFSSRIEAQQAQGAFARREHVMGMIRKMDA